MKMFLQITDEYAIESDVCSWALSRKRITKREGEHYQQFAWYSTLEDAVNGLARRMIRSSEADNLITAMRDVDKVVYNITKALEPNFKITTKE